MFGKIKDRLKNVFKSSEEVIQGDETDILEVEEDNKKELEAKIKKEEELEKELDIKETPKETESDIEPEEKKPGFLERIFKSREEKDENEIEELESLEDEMLEDVSIEEKDAIKEKKPLNKETVQKNKKELETKIKKEEELEKDTSKQIEEQEVKKDFVEKKLEENNEKNIIEPSAEIQDSESESESKKSEGFFSKAFGKLKSKKIDDDDFDKIWLDLEIFLLEINVAFEIVEIIQNSLKKELIGNSFDRFNLTRKIREVLEIEVEKVLVLREDDLLEKITKINKLGEVAKIIILGVNGTGKTTSIAKIVNLFQKNNLSVVVAAADTFRAAAIEQLEEHSKKLNFKLIQHKNGSDPAAVAYDSIEHAKAKKLNVALIDTAGRMPNNSNLMQELQKIKRVSQSQITLFIGDSISGNDLIDQIELFDKAVQIDGVILTKVDTDERPGSIITTAYSINKPIYYLGIGQNYDDLIKFDGKQIAHKLFSIEDDE